jgi:AAA+ superfamily predicted ATPase
MSAGLFPAWAEEMREVFRAGTAGGFLLSGNVSDLVPAPASPAAAAGSAGSTPAGEGAAAKKFMALREYLAEVLFAPFEVVLAYDRGGGLRALRGAAFFGRFLAAVDKHLGTSYSSVPDGGESLEKPGALPRAPVAAIEILDRFMYGTLAARRNGAKEIPGSIAIILDRAQFVFPVGEALQISGDSAAALLRVLGWMEDPELAQAGVAICLLAPQLGELNSLLVESPHAAKIHIPLPSIVEMQAYVESVAESEARFAELSPLPPPELAQRLVGLSRVGARSVLLRALRNGQTLSDKFLARLRKETIEKEAAGRLEFLDSQRTLDDVSGHDAAKAWLRSDAALMREGATHALPMGYLLAGRIGTGKTYLVQCFAGECGVPFVELKNFRDRWVGSTEANLEKVFAILRALGRVVVFVDEADQATGKRDSGDGDSGLSGRVYAMLAKEMSDTRNRGRILWIFATSRPDLVEVDLKRQGRLDVHIPLFPPDTAAGRKSLIASLARKLGVGLAEADIPEIDFPEGVGGNEFEGLLVRTARTFALQTDARKMGVGEILKQEAAGFRPSAHLERLEFMDLLAVKECTDAGFLPARFRSMDAGTLERRLADLAARFG